MFKLIIQVILVFFFFEKLFSFLRYYFKLVNKFFYLLSTSSIYLYLNNLMALEILPAQHTDGKTTTF